MPPRYNQVAVTIEMFCDMKTLTFEELVGRLRAAEDRFEPSVEQVTDKAGRLLLTEEEWVVRNKSHIVQPDSSSSSGEKGSGQYAKKDRPGAHGSGGGGNSHESRDSSARLTSMGTPRRKGRCRKCGLYGHWEKECMNKKSSKERTEAAHHVNVDND